MSGTTTVSANASDNVGVIRVELYVDGGLIGSDTTSPYQIAWNTTTATNGGHGLQTRAVDAAGQRRLERGRQRHGEQRHAAVAS